MMNSKPPEFYQERSKFFLVVVLLLILLPAAVFVAQRSQELRKLAKGSQEVTLQIEPSEAVLSAGDTITSQLTLQKLVDREIKVSGVQATLSVSEAMTVSKASCLSPFDGLPFVKTENGKVTLMCSISVNDQPQAIEKTSLPWGELELSASGKSASGTGTISFEKTRITEAGVTGQAPDVSTQGEGVSYTVATNEGVKVFFREGETVDGNTEVKLLIDSGSTKIAFVRSVFTFDPKVVLLSSEVTAAGAALSTVIDTTSSWQANQTGKVIVVLGATPGEELPSGEFELASFYITPVVNSANLKSVLSLLTSNMQIVDSQANDLTIEPTDLELTLNQGQVEPSGGEEPTVSEQMSEVTEVPEEEEVEAEPTEAEKGQKNGSPPGKLKESAVPKGLLNAPAEPCSHISSVACYKQWKAEYLGFVKTTKADLNSDGKVDIEDFKIWIISQY